MGFNFDNAVGEVSIQMEIFQDIDGVLSTEVVTHVFRVPTARELEQYRQKLTKMKGRRPKVRYSDANRYLWSTTIIKVDGYEELPKDWKKFFLNDGKAQIHVNSAVDELLEVVMPSGDFEKN